MKLDREKIFKSFVEHKDVLEKRNAEGIEKYRKGDFTLKFAAKMAGKVTVKQKKHNFLFGCNAFMLDSFETPEKEPIYKEKFAKLFNQAVVPFYWKDLEPEEGRLRFRKDSENIYRRPAPDIVLDFCQEYGIEPKGHCIVWNWWVPDWLHKYTAQEAKSVLERRFKELADEYADKIPSWDIVNESATNYRFGAKNLFENYDEYGLCLGAKYFPNNRKIINETNAAIWENYHTQGKYMAFNMQLKDFINRGIPFDEIGLQYHIFCASEEMEQANVLEKYLDASSMVEILDIYDAYNLPMHISEITIPGSEQKAENEEKRKRKKEQFYGGKQVQYATGKDFFKVDFPYRKTRQEHCDRRHTRPCGVYNGKDACRKFCTQTRQTEKNTYRRANEHRIAKTLQTIF
jgi:GH35 family endo-1,4-beta-xylanase